MLQCSFSFAAAQLLVQMTSALQKRQCCSAVPAAQHSENCSATSVFACGMLQVWGLEGSGLGLAECQQDTKECLNQRGASISVSKRNKGMKVPLKRGKRGKRHGTGPGGERGGKNEGKRVGGKGPESAVEKL